jgi:hypothetical protein
MSGYVINTDVPKNVVWNIFLYVNNYKHGDDIKLSGYIGQTWCNESILAGIIHRNETLIVLP